MQNSRSLKEAFDSYLFILWFSFLITVGFVTGVWSARGGTWQCHVLLITCVVNHTRSTSQCFSAFCIQWWWGGCPVAVSRKASVLLLSFWMGKRLDSCRSLRCRKKLSTLPRSGLMKVSWAWWTNTIFCSLSSPCIGQHRRLWSRS